MYKVVYAFSPNSTGFKKIPNSIKNIIKKAIELKLTTEPTIFGKPLKHKFKGKWKLRVGNYRVIYTIDHEIVTVFIMEIDHRKDVYEE